MKKIMMTMLGMAALPLLANTPPEITNVRASQREDTKLVDIYYDAADADGDLLKVRIEISDNDGAKYSVPAFSLTGDIGEGIAAGKDKHIVWDAGADWDGEYSDKMRVKVYAIDAQGFPGLEWGNEVPPGGFLMGQDGGAEGSGPSRHVNIPWSYWLSKYEITAAQYCEFLNAALAADLVDREDTENVYSKMGAQVMPHLGGKYLMIKIGDAYDIRWNVNKFEVVGTYSNFPVSVTWYGAMMFAHFYGYDLPTEAEWEKAARGPDNDDQDEHLKYPWGNTIAGSFANYKGSGDPYESHGTTPVGYFNGNQIPVGVDTVNGYGLYDMCGNLSELTLTTASSDYSVETYPQQDSLAAERNLPASGVDGASIDKGGNWGDSSTALSLYQRGSASRAQYASYRGFRVARRNGGDRPVASKETFGFEDWDASTSTSYNNFSSVTNGGFVWRYNGAAWTRCGADAYSGKKYVQLGQDNRGGSLYFQSSSNSIIEVRIRIKNPSAYEKDINTSWGNYVSIAGNSEYQLISFVIPVSRQNDELSIYSYYGLCVDEVEMVTIPRNN